MKLTLIITASLLIGIMAGSLLLPGVLTKSSSGAENDGLVLSGTETIKVLSPSGALVSQWSGPDPLSGIAINALAACIPGTNGGSTDPVGPPSVTGASGSCSSFINAIAIVFAPGAYGAAPACTDNAGAETLNGYSVSGCEALTSATNFLTPLGCNPNEITIGGQLCSGWITQATFGPGTFTATNCIYDQSQTPCSVVEVDAGILSQMGPYPGGYGNSEGFDYLNPTPIAVAAGDSLLVTIQFTVS